MHEIMRSPRAGLPIVGIGASAGGLAAFKSFLDNVPADSGMAYVLIQHLDPVHPSMLVELLALHSSIPVELAGDGVTVSADHVYVIPPNATLTIKSGVLHVNTPAPAREHRRPIDTFFVSLAEDQGELAASIVLAGVGSDGTQGLRAIKASGGLTMAQAEHDETALSGMPMSAAATGLVDHVVPVEAMPGLLIEHRQQHEELRDWKYAHAAAEDWPRHLHEIAARLHTAVGHDFADYKQSTMIRRVQRRMQALGIENVPDYIAALQSDKREPDLLFRDLLIGVTQFFRDPEAFAALASTVIPPLLDGRDPEDPIRIWVAGCATGEEVYSLAILLQEALDEHKSPVKLQVFGTDVDVNAIAVARAGRYREPMPGLSPERIAKWFVRDGELLHPAKRIREMCIFSAHSLVKDPPFSKLDLVSCRNVLIYLNRELQHRILQTFHYALKPGGWLFLGPSESAMRDEALFRVVDRKDRILQRRDDVRAALPSLRSGRVLRLPLRADAARSGPTEERMERNLRAAMERLSPAMLVVNRQHEIVRFFGADIGKYLEPSPGTATLNLFALLRKTLRPIVRSSMQKAVAGGEAVVEPGVVIGDKPESQAITLIVEPIDGDVAVIAFRETLDGTYTGASHDGVDDGATPSLEREMRATRIQLKAAVDELETQIEDTRSATEEMQSVNEELQSANEELETAKEEMQSVNEELQTVNGELQSKNQELIRLNDDLQNLLDSTHIATLFLDRDLRVRSFTPAMTEIFHLRDGDRARPITEIASRLAYDHFERDVATVQRTLAMVEREVTPKDSGSTFLMRIRPYRTRDDRLDGVVVTFVDVSAVKAAEKAHRETESMFRLAQKAAGIGSWTWDIASDVVSATQENARLMGADPGDPPPNYKGFMARIHPEDVLAVEAEIAKCRAAGGDWEREYRVVREGKVRWLLGKGHLLRGADGSERKVVGVNLDITERRARDEREQFLLRELGHRTQNLLALATALIRQTEGESDNVREFSKRCTERLLALDRAQRLLGKANWTGASLTEVAQSVLEPYIGANFARVTFDGPDVVLEPKAVDSLSLTLNELATNAIKHGALSIPSGKVELRWQLDGAPNDRPHLHLTWSEVDGPPVVAPLHKGFGHRVVEELPRLQLGAVTSFTFPRTGVQWSADLPGDVLVTAGTSLRTNNNSNHCVLSNAIEHT